MTRFAVAAFAVIVLFGSSALAQNSTAKMQAFVGYSFLHADTGGLTGPALSSALHQPAGELGVTSHFSGWNGEVQYNLKPWLGVVADFAGHYGNPFTSSNNQLTELPHSNSYSLMGGPVLSLKVGRKLTPFVHGLAGFDRFHLKAGSIPGLFGSSAFVTDKALAVAVGGGIDYKMYPHFSIRLGQFDYFYTAHNLNTIYGTSFGPNLFPTLATHEYNLRFSTGIVVRF
jgi:hypothetical protein